MLIKRKISFINSNIKKKLLNILFIFIFSYTIIHFLYNGIYFPIVNENLGHIYEETRSLINFLHGNEFILDNPRQYGPFFILVIFPFMLIYYNSSILHLLLLGLQYILAGSAFYLCYKYIFLDKPIKKISLSILLIIWLNFSPLMYIFAVKNVEVWELFLICFGFVMFIKKRFFWTGFAFAAATLTKFLPGIFMFYLFFKNKKAFCYSILCFAIILIIAHLIFGPQIGILYFPFLITRAIGSRTWGVLHFENNSLKGLIYKIFSGFKTDDENVFFLISPDAEKWAFFIATILQLIIIIYIIFIALRKKCSKEELMIQFSLISVLMLIVSPVSAHEYGTLLLFAYSVGVYFIFYKNLENYLHIIFWTSYLLVGNLIPMNVITKIFNINLEQYRLYSIPLIGFIFLAIFFILIWHNKNNYVIKNEN